MAEPGKRVTSPVQRKESSITRDSSKVKSSLLSAGAKKDTSKSTNEGEWEMRDGKWYRRDYYAIKAGEQQKQTVKVKCPNCPTYQERITVLTKERDTFQQSLKEKEAELSALQSKYSQLDVLRGQLETTIRELEERLRNSGDSVHTTIREKETIIIGLGQKIKEYEAMLAAKDAEIAELQKKMGDLLGICSDLDQRLSGLQGLQGQVDELTKIKMELELRISTLTAELGVYEGQSKLIQVLEEQVAYCKANHGKELTRALPPQQPAESINWYYAVQDPVHAQMFQKEKVYAGGEIVIDSLEGATVVNPDYYVQSERIEGNSRLRVRVVYAQTAGAIVSPAYPTSEIFVRLRLGSATQFTPPRPHNHTVTWNQDFVFVGVPVVEKDSVPGAFIPAESLTVEVISRAIGGAAETLLGSAIVDLANIIYGITRQVMVSLNKGGIVNLRVKALDFGLPAPAGAQSDPYMTYQSPYTSAVETSTQKDTCEVALDIKREDAYGRMGIELQEFESRKQLFDEHVRLSPQVSPHKVSHVTYTVTETIQGSH